MLTAIPDDAFRSSNALLHRFGHRFDKGGWVAIGDGSTATIRCQNVICQKQFRLTDFSVDRWGLLYLHTVHQILLRQVDEKPELVFLPKFNVFWCDRVKSFV